MAVGIKTEQQIVGGLSVIGKRLTVTDCAYVDHAFKGSPSGPKAMLVLLDDDNTESTQYWSCGGSDQLKPSTDGQTLEAVKEGAGLRASCKWAGFIASLQRANWPSASIPNDGNITFLKGAVLVLEEEEFKSDFTKTDASGNEQKQRNIVVREILEAPPGVTITDTAAVTEEADQIVVAMLQNGNGEPILWSDVINHCIPAISGHAHEPALMQTILSVEYLSGENRAGELPWNWDAANSKISRK